MSNEPTSKQLVFHGPVTVDLRVAVTDGTRDGVVTFSMPMGRYPAAAEIAQAIEEAASQVGGEFRLMTKREWWAMESQERFGCLYAMPGSEEWDATGSAA